MGVCTSAPASTIDLPTSPTPPPSGDSSRIGVVVVDDPTVTVSRPLLLKQPLLLGIIVPTQHRNLLAADIHNDQSVLAAGASSRHVESSESSCIVAPIAFVPMSPSFFSNSTDCGLTPSRTQQISVELSTPVVRKFTDSLAMRDMAIAEIPLSPAMSPIQPHLQPRKESKSPSPLCLESISKHRRQQNATVDMEVNEMDSKHHSPAFLDPEECAHIELEVISANKNSTSRTHAALDDNSNNNPIEATFMDPTEAVLKEQEKSLSEGNNSPASVECCTQRSDSDVCHSSLPSSTIFIPTSPVPILTKMYVSLPDSPNTTTLLSSSSVFVSDSVTSISASSSQQQQRLPLICELDLRSIKSPRGTAFAPVSSSFTVHDRVESSPSSSSSGEVVKLVRRPRGAKWKNRSEERNNTNTEKIDTTQMSIEQPSISLPGLDEKPATISEASQSPHLLTSNPPSSTSATAVDITPCNPTDLQTSKDAMKSSPYDAAVGIIKPRALKPIVMPLVSCATIDSKHELPQQPLPPQSPPTSPIKILYYPTNLIKFIRAPTIVPSSDLPRQYSFRESKESFADSVQFQTTIPTAREPSVLSTRRPNLLPEIDMSLIRRFKPRHMKSESKPDPQQLTTSKQRRYSRSLVDHWKEPANYSCNIPPRFGASSPVSTISFQNHTVLELLRTCCFNWGSDGQQTSVRNLHPSKSTMAQRETKSINPPEPVHRNPFIHPHYLPYLDLNMTHVPAQPLLLPILMHRQITPGGSSKSNIPASSLTLQPVNMKRTMDLLRARRKPAEILAKDQHPIRSVVNRPLTPIANPVPLSCNPRTHRRSRFASRFAVSVPPLDLSKIPKFRPRSRPTSAGNVLYDSSRKQQPLFLLTPKPLATVIGANTSVTQSNISSRVTSVAAITFPPQPPLDHPTVEAVLPAKLAPRSPSPSRLLIRAAKPSTTNISTLLQQQNQRTTSMSSVDCNVVVRTVNEESKFIQDVQASNSAIDQFCEKLKKQVRQQGSIHLLKLFASGLSSTTTAEDINEESVLRVLDCFSIPLTSSACIVRVEKLDVTDIPSETIVRRIMQLIGSGSLSSNSSALSSNSPEVPRSGVTVSGNQQLLVRSLALRLSFPSFEKRSPPDLSHSDFGVHNNGITTVLAALKRMKFLQSLSLAGCNLATIAGRFVQVTSQHPSLSSLDISSNDIKNEELSQITLALLHPLCRLTDLNISSNSISEVGLQALCSSLMRKSVPPVPYPVDQLSTSASIGPGPATSEFLLRSQTRGLNKLSLEGNDLSGSRGAEALAQWLQHSSCCLTELNLSSCKLSPSGLKTIGNGIRHSSLLTSLNIAGNLALPIGKCEQAGSSCIESLSLNRSLRELDLRDNQLLNHWIAATNSSTTQPSSLFNALLEFITVHPSIEILYFSGNGLSRDESAELQARLKQKAIQRLDCTNSKQVSTKPQTFIVSKHTTDSSLISLAPVPFSLLPTSESSFSSSNASSRPATASRYRSNIIPTPNAVTAALARARDEYRIRQNANSFLKTEVTAPTRLFPNLQKLSKSNSAACSSNASLHPSPSRFNSSSQPRSSVQPSISNQAQVQSQASQLSLSISTRTKSSSVSPEKIHPKRSSTSPFHSVSEGPFSLLHSSAQVMASHRYQSKPRRTNLAEDFVRLRLEKTLAITSPLVAQPCPVLHSQSNACSSKYLAK